MLLNYCVAILPLQAALRLLTAIDDACQSLVIAGILDENSKPISPRGYQRKRKRWNKRKHCRLQYRNYNYFDVFARVNRSAAFVLRVFIQGFGWVKVPCFGSSFPSAFLPRYLFVSLRARSSWRAGPDSECRQLQCLPPRIGSILSVSVAFGICIRVISVSTNHYSRYS